jgi:phosphoglycerate dehydrogenase-like enzyme
MATRLREKGEWAGNDYMSRAYMINEKTVGLLGLGNIGRNVGKIVKNGFGATVQYYDVRRLPEDVEKELGFKFVGVDELLATSDIISVHVPLLPSTEGMINREALAKMKSTAILINAARGPIINEKDLIEALQNKVILGAGLDTFTEEPLNPSSPLLTMDNVVCTPHAAGNTVDNEINMVKLCLSNIAKYDAGEELRLPVLVNGEYLKK